jgi:hypothetical protein
VKVGLDTLDGVGRDKASAWSYARQPSIRAPHDEFVALRADDGVALWERLDATALLLGQRVRVRDVHGVPSPELMVVWCVRPTSLGADAAPASGACAGVLPSRLPAGSPEMVGVYEVGVLSVADRPGEPLDELCSCVVRAQVR